MPRAPVLEGRYANHFDVGHNAFEFVIDFGQAYDPADVCRSHTRIVTSPLPRARATAEIVAEELDAEDLLETADVLRAGADAPAIQGWLRERTEDRLMIVGHNPALTDLITLLVLGATRPQPQVCELKKGGMAALQSSSSSPDRSDLIWVATPRLIRRLARQRSGSRK